MDKAGYPRNVLVSVAQKLLKEIKSCKALSQGRTQNVVRKRPQKCTAIPYIHKVSHNLKRIGQRADIRVALTAPNKLSKLCSRVNNRTYVGVQCNKTHRSQFVNCVANVVYRIPLTCGKEYVGQTGHCLYERLREHQYNVTSGISGHLGIHCKRCGCNPEFSKCEVLATNRNQLTREIIEAHKIAMLKDRCVSTPSVLITDKEIVFLTAGDSW